MAAPKRAVSAAQKDLTEARQRAKSARTPIAKAVTKRVVEAKERAYSGKASREAAAQMRRGVHPSAIGTPKAAKAAPKRTPRRGRAT